MAGTQTMFATILAVGVLAGPALAQERPSTTAMTCSEAARLVRGHGALILGTGGQTFDRFVRDRSFCEPTEIARRAFRLTRDVRACLVGYTCYEPSIGDRLGSDL